MRAVPVGGETPMKGYATGGRDGRTPTSSMRDEQSRAILRTQYRVTPTRGYTTDGVPRDAHVVNATRTIAYGETGVEGLCDGYGRPEMAGS